MKLVHFYISNSNHHWEMMKPVMQQLMQQGIQVQLISLCEFRRMQTPEPELRKLKIQFIRLASLRFKGTSTSTGKKHIGGNKALLRNFLRSLIWFALLRPSLKRVNRRKPDLVVVPNDIAYPFSRICRWFVKRNIPFMLQQEGIRFPLPNESGGMAYGTNGAMEILAWGDNAVRYFKEIGVSAKITAAGNPRFDSLFLKNSRYNKLLPIQNELGKFNILYVSNPVDDQGFCSHDEKIEIFKKFLIGVSSLYHQDIRVFIRLHPREDRDSFQRIISEFGSGKVHWAQNCTLFECLRAMNLTVILASTVGLESMMVDTPVAVIKLPKHGYVFNYVSSSCALALDVNENFSEILWNALSIDYDKWKNKCKEYVEDQLSNRGSSSSFIANHLAKLLHAGA